MSIDISSAIIYLIDDEPVICDSIKCFIESTGLNIKCFNSAEGFLANYDNRQPGCLILDVRMPVMNGLELQELLLKENIEIPIIFISGNANIPDSAKAFRAGALDFLEKPFDNQLLLERLHEAIVKDIESRNKKFKNEHLYINFNRLTCREKEVLKLLIDHNSSKQIARQLDISPRTIDAHRARIMEKMQANNVVELVAKALYCRELFEF
ncbi:response regulator [Methylomonas sp. AM2-LC]|uniref:response regulator transcription factor n=1 Tax=Methylomonas sp. AM2-LC TaxID=3153301 RepID=UPI0032663668